MMTNERFLKLLQKYSAKLTTELEVAELMEAVNSGQYDDLLKAYLDEQLQLPPTADISDSRAKELFLKIVKDSKAAPKQKTVNRNWQKIGAAIAAVFIVGIGLTIFFNQGDSSALSARQVVIVPGSDKATLTLGDGSQVVLDSTSQGEIAQQANNQVVNANGTLLYSNTTQANSTKEILYNTVTTPRGGQYALTLPDGTKVWLNAASSLRYPVTASNEKRVVELTGEAYFEVATVQRSQGKGKIPFIVSVEGMEVEVLGTHFNIMSYGEEPALQTTLLEGAVRVTHKDMSVLLEPGQQVQLPKSGNLYMSESVDLKQVMAWKNGYFRFNDTNVTTIMNQLGRWYDFTAVYENDKVKELDFGGIVSRKDQIQEMLELMELTGAVHFDVEGRTILVKTGQKDDYKN